MKKRVQRQLVALFWLLVMPGSWLCAELMVVVNPKSGVLTLTRNEVISIFLGRYRQFFNGQIAQPVDLTDDHPDRAGFYKLLVGKECAEIDAYWSRQVFAGRTKPPARVAGPEAVIKWVMEHPGGIGYVDLPKADARVRVVLELKP